MMERDLAAFEDWTEATVIQRRARIVAWAKDRWAVTTTDVPLILGEEIDELGDEEALDFESVGATA